MVLAICIFLATPAEVIDHYYCFMLDNLDNSVLWQIMIDLELLTKEDLVHFATMYSDYQKTAFLLDKLMLTGTVRIVEFCSSLQNKDNQQELGRMLMNGESKIYCSYYSVLLFLFFILQL